MSQRTSDAPPPLRAQHFVFVSEMSSGKCVFGCGGKLTPLSFYKDRGTDLVFPGQQHSQFMSTVQHWLCRETEAKSQGCSNTKRA